MNKKIEGFVVKSVDYKDYDSLISVVSKDDLFLIRARGVKKSASKNKSLCLLYSHSQFEVYESSRGYMTLKGGTFLDYYKEIYSSYINTLFFSIVSFYVTSSFKKDFSYHLLKRVSKKIKEKCDLKILFIAFLNEVFLEEGINFNLDGCLNCGNKKNIVDFSFEEGGFICRKCNFKSIKEKKYLQTLRYLLKTKIDDCDKIKDDDFEKLDYISQNLVSLLEDKGGIKFYNWEMFKHLIYKGGTINDFK